MRKNGKNPFLSRVLFLNIIKHKILDWNLRGISLFFFLLVQNLSTLYAHLI
jgi:hypothetical protein